MFGGGFVKRCMDACVGSFTRNLRGFGGWDLAL